MAGQIPEKYGEGRMAFPSEDLSNQNKIRHMMFPGTTISHALIQPDEQQKKIMKHKYDGTSEWDWRDDDARKAAWEYDNHPEVIERRWNAMRPMAKLMCWSNNANIAAYCIWNGGLAICAFRLYFSSFRTAFVPWAFFCGVMFYADGFPELL
jgi:hypothetical protein